MTIDSLTLLPLFFLIVVIGYAAYQSFPRDLTEEEMMRRLVHKRFSRKLYSVTVEDLNQEIEQAAEAMLNKAKGPNPGPSYSIEV